MGRHDAFDGEKGSGVGGQPVGILHHAQVGNRRDGGLAAEAQRQGTEKENSFTHKF